jgi:hypothetical protein
MPVATSLENINHVIQSHSPFNGHFVVKSQQIWANELPDLSSHNSHASKVVLDAVRKIKSGNLTTLGVVFIAPKGTGKTHILSRIRRRLKDSGDGIFVYMSEYGKLNSIKNQFLQGLISSLRKTGSKDVMQCQEVVTELLNHALNKKNSPKQLVASFPRIISQRPHLLDQITTRIFQLNLGLEDPYIIRALIWTLSPIHAPYALNWLAGKEITEAQAEKLGLPNISEKDRESYSFNTALQILNLISHYKIPVICFDELDGTETGEEEELTIGGFTRAMVVASLGKDLYNSLRKGVLVSAMYDRTWRHEVSGINANEAAVDRIAEKKIDLSPLNPDSITTLVKCWLESFYNQHSVKPPYELYPFDENELKEFGKEKPTVRDVLKWCSERFSPGLKPVDPVEEIEQIYQEIESTLEDVLDDNEKIADALAFAFHQLKGKTLEGVKIDSVDKEVNPKYKNSGYIQFRILGEESGQKVKIGVGVLQNSHGKGVGAGLKRLTWYRDFDLTRGCLVRSKSIPGHWQVANDHLNKLTKELGGEWVGFKKDEVKPLIALKEVFKLLDDYDFSQGDFNRFLEQSIDLLLNNNLLLEILSDPSGETPEEIIDEDAELERAISEASESATEEDMELMLVS